MNESNYYYIKDVDCPSSLTTMERRVTEVARKYRGYAISEEALQRIIKELKEEQIRIKCESPRLREVEISISASSVSSVIWLYIGRNAIVLHNITGFIE